jgi:hypothetical protein
MRYPKRSQYKYAKTRYRFGNWPEYEAGLRQRGDLTEGQENTKQPRPPRKADGAATHQNGPG